MSHVFYGDYHTHTTYSHGKGSVRDNVRRANELGLREVAITDHGLSHIAFGLSDSKVESMQVDIENVRKEFPNITIIGGVESNIIGLDGTIDLVDEEFDWFNIILCGFHKFVWPKGLKDYYQYFVRNYFYDAIRTNAPEKVVNQNTDAYINAIRKNPIDVLTHINYGLRVRCQEVAEAAKECGTFIELSGKRITYSDVEFVQMAETGVQFIFDSDAHSVDRIMNFDLAIALLDRVGYPLDRVVNYSSKPEFRSRKK